MSKASRVLELLLRRGPRGLNRFEAVNEAHDWVLPSTISALQARGVPITSQIERVRGFGGHETRVARYAIAKPDRARAEALLSTMRSRRRERRTEQT